ncbi:ubiquitin-binding protein cue5 [Didymella pomorum]|uniref:Ubiquitin-binding protein cue5 n=1 Tax=Didymella pomorum TaxID=749634 RepID=A0A9W8Z0K4_9PLEO|nr:ubiquitin-binding protein cue5 [Didymella pomorum]
MSEKAANDKPPESPTTARELDFDDDNDAPASSATDKAASPPPPSKSPKAGVRFSEQAEEIPPQKPPRPVDPNVQAQNTLIEAFPDIDTNVVKAVLVASGGKVEPAFNALLSMSDPNFKAEEAAPPKPPRPQHRSQVDQDEMYARQLAEHFQSQGGQQGQGGEGSERRSSPYARSNNQSQNKDDREYSFFDDDLPEIRKNIEQGFQETQKTVNKWITSFKKKLDGEPDDYDQYGNLVQRERGQSSQGRQNFGPSQSDQMYGIRKSAEQRRSADMRRSADHNRYDADNRVLGDDFAQLELRDNDPQQRSSSRPSANPDLFKPTPVSPPQSGPVDEVDALYRNPSPNSQGGKSGSKKWQPLTSVAPHPDTDEHDPFSLGDSDDEDNKTKDTNPEDTERLKKAAETKAKESTVAELKPATRSGSVGQKDAAAEALLKDAK